MWGSGIFVDKEVHKTIILIQYTIEINMKYCTRCLYEDI